MNYHLINRVRKERAIRLVDVPGWKPRSALIGCWEDTYSSITLASDWLLMEGVFAQVAEKIGKILPSSLRLSMLGSRKGAEKAFRLLRSILSLAQYVEVLHHCCKLISARPWGPQACVWSHWFGRSGYWPVLVDASALHCTSLSVVNIDTPGFSQTLMT